MRDTFSFLLVTIILALSLGCSDDSPTSGSAAKDADAEKVDMGGSGDQDAGQDTSVSSSCKGISAESLKQFSQYDSQCAFLAECPASGQCYCGDTCSESKTLCNKQICAGVNATCLCGEQCEPKRGEVLCPEHVCTEAGDIKGCQKLPSCRYVAKALDPICKCTQMPSNEPDCWCGGDKCPSHYPSCSPQLCKGKNPEKCVVVPGENFTNCYCATCGLHGDKPTCFFVVCPGSKE